jgi:hypothetical protein
MLVGGDRLCCLYIGKALLAKTLAIATGALFGSAFAVDNVLIFELQSIQRIIVI